MHDGSCREKGGACIYSAIMSDGSLLQDWTPSQSTASRSGQQTQRGTALGAALGASGRPRDPPLLPLVFMQTVCFPTAIYKDQRHVNSSMLAHQIAAQ